MSASRKAISTLLLAPLLGIAVLTVQPATFMGDVAYAQNNANAAASNNNGRVSSLSRTPTRTISRDGGGGASGDRILGRLSKIPPCPPGTAPTPNCRPWTPPVVVAESKDDCQCKMRRVNGQMIKDCYVMVQNLVHYCKAGFLQRQ
jgi:hypothetical protein